MPKSKKIHLDQTGCHPHSDPAVINPALVGCFTYCFHRSGLRLKEDLNTALSAFGISVPQFGILAVLKSKGPLNQNVLGEEMGIDKATMVRLIDGLEKLRAVDRTTGVSDRRAKAIEVTPHGLKMFTQANRAREKVENGFLSTLPKAHQKIIRDGVAKLLLKPQAPKPR